MMREDHSEGWQWVEGGIMLHFAMVGYRLTAAVVSC